MKIQESGSGFTLQFSGTNLPAVIYKSSSRLFVPTNQMSNWRFQIIIHRRILWLITNQFPLQTYTYVFSQL